MLDRNKNLEHIGKIIMGAVALEELGIIGVHHGNLPYKNNIYPRPAYASNLKENIVSTAKTLKKEIENSPELQQLLKKEKYLLDACIEYEDFKFCAEAGAKINDKLQDILINSG